MNTAHELPETGQVIRFVVPPAGSYASAGIDYCVTRQGKTIHLKRETGSSGTSDKAWAYKDAMWAVMAEAV